MSHKPSIAVLILAAATLLAATVAPPLRATASDSAAVRDKPAGLTAHGIALASEVAAKKSLVTMAPQTSLTLLSRATLLGAHAPDSKIRLTVSLKLAQPDALRTFLEEVQYPGSSVYHVWLTPGEAAARFGPTASQVKAVTHWLKSQGIHVTDVTPNHLLIHTEAKTSVYAHAFGLHINDYDLNGRTFYSTSDRPRIPRTIAGYVQNLIGLDKAVVLHPMHTVKALPRSLTSRAASPLAPPPQTSSGYFWPQQIATAYDVPDITDPAHGAGVTIAILTASSSGLADNTDYSRFWAAFGLPDHQVTVIPVDGDNGSSDGMLETQLDMQWSGVWAPGADLRVYVAADPSIASMLDMFSRFQTDNAAQVMTISWGAPEQSWPTVEKTAESIFALAATQGISMFSAAGDKGSSDGLSGTNNACDYPSASLYITAASGTELRTDLQGNRISEVASVDTGGAVCKLPRPAWQTGPGMPGNNVRNTGDLALNYGNVNPYLLVSGGNWVGVAGTSAVAPQLAGMFADAVARAGDRIGQSNELIYSLVHAGYQASDFFDVTSGSNGAWSAGPGWDHPTGWGTPNAASMISYLGVQGPKGTLGGSITAAASGSAIGGAYISAVDTATHITYAAASESDGAYTRVLPTGTFDVTVSAFGYKDSTRTVTISDGQTSTENFSLRAEPQATLHGVVSDGSGHGYPLYAHIRVSSPASSRSFDVWTDPVTGEYSISLPEGASYRLEVTAAFHGYETASDTITLSAGAERKDFSLRVLDSCTAPGYVFDADGLGEDFDEGSFPPAGWTVTNPVNGSVTWKLASQLPSDSGNYTGGTGDAASADSHVLNAGNPATYDTSLVTPLVSVASLHGASMLKYKANYIALGGDAFDLDISTDGANTWTHILHWTTDHGDRLGPDGVEVLKDLAGYLPPNGSFPQDPRLIEPGHKKTP